MKKVFIFVFLLIISLFLSSCGTISKADIGGVWESVDYVSFTIYNLYINDDGTYEKLGYLQDSSSVTKKENGKYFIDGNEIRFEYFIGKTLYENTYVIEDGEMYDAIYYSDGELNRTNVKYRKINHESLLNQYLGRWSFDTNLNDDVDFDDYDDTYEVITILTLNTFQFLVDEESNLTRLFLLRSDGIYLDGYILNAGAYNLNLEDLRATVSNEMLILSGTYMFYNGRVEVIFKKIEG